MKHSKTYFLRLLASFFIGTLFLISLPSVNAQTYIEHADVVDFSGSVSESYIHPNGHIYMLNSTDQAGISTTDGSVFGGGAFMHDVVYTHYDENGNVLDKAYIGGSSGDFPEAIHVDENNNVFIISSTTSGDFPIMGGSGSLIGLEQFTLSIFNSAGQMTFSDYINTAHNLDPRNDNIRITGDGNGNNFLVWSSKNAGGNHDLAILKFATNGTFLDDTIIPSNADRADPHKLIAKDGFLHLISHEPDNARKYRKLDYQLNDLFSFDIGEYADLDVDNNFIYLIGNTATDPGFAATDGSAFSSQSYYIMKREISTNDIVYLSYFETLFSSSFGFIKVDEGDMYIALNGASELAHHVTDGSSYTGDWYYDVLFMKKNSLGITQYAGYYGDLLNDYVWSTALGSDYFWLDGITEGGFITTDGSYQQGSEDRFALAIDKNTGKVVLANRFGGPQRDYYGNFGLVTDGFVYVGRNNTSGITDNVLISNPKGPLGRSYYAKFTTCPTNFSLGTTVSPMVQNVCQNGLVNQIVADPTFIDGATFPTLYKNGIPSVQHDINAIYQWQKATSLAGPWEDIFGAIGKNYTPDITVTDKYYRRIDKAFELCGGAILNTTDVSSVIVNGFVAPVADAGGIFNSCPGLTETIGATPLVTGGTPPYNVEWFEGNSTVAFSTIDNPSVATGAAANSIVYTIIVTDDNTCKHIDQSVLNVYEADAGADGSFCEGSAGVRIGGDPIPGVAGVIYAWSPAVGLSCTDCPQPIANPAVATTYTLDLTVPRTSGSTCSSTDDVVVTPVLAPTNGGGDFAGPDEVICLGTVVTIGLASEAGFTYTWAPGNYLTDNHISQTTVETGNLKMPSPDPLLYYLTAQKDGCTFVDEMEVSVIEARADIDGCGPRFVGKFDRTPSISETYTWSIVSGTGTFQGVTNKDVVPVTATPSGGSTTYQLDVLYNGHTCTDQVIVPDCGCVVDIEVAAPFECPDFSLNNGNVSLMATANTIDFQDPDYFTYTWSPATGLSSTTGRVVTLTDDVQRTYTVTMSDPSGSGFMCSQTIAVNNPAWSLPVFVSPDQTTCVGTPIQIGAPTVGGYDYEWEESTDLSSLVISDPIATVTEHTNFMVTVTDVGSGCIAQDTTIVSVGNVAADAGPDHLVCDNGIITLGTTAVPGATYAWTPVGASWQNGTDETYAEPEVLVAINTTFDLTVTHTASGCMSTDQVDVTVGTGVPAFAMADISFCPSTSGPLSLGTGAPVGGITNYAWTPSIYLDDATVVHPNTTSLPNSAILFTLVVTNADGCEQISTQSIIPSITPPIVGGDKVLCMGETTMLGDAANPTGGGISYLWAPATDLSDATNPNPTFTANTAGTTSYTLTKTEAGCDVSLSINVVVNEYTIPALETKTVCQNGCVTIGTPVEGGVSYFWTPSVGIASPNDASTLVCPTASTTYTLIAQGGNGCIAEQDVLVSVNPTNAPTVTAPDLLGQCLGTTGSTFNATVVPAGTYDYTWSPGDGTLNDIYSASPQVDLTAVGTKTYSVTVIDPATGCSTTEEVALGVIMCPTLSVDSAVPSACNIISNTYSLNVTLLFTNAPTGDITIITDNGASQTFTPSSQDGAETFTLVGLSTDGVADIDVTATYVDDNAVTHTIIDAYSAPADCSCKPEICLPITIARD